MSEQCEKVCIVGYGAMLPDAPDAECFWRNLLAGVCSIRELPKSRWDDQDYRNGPESPHSYKAAFIADDLISTAAERLGLSAENTRLQIMGVTAAEQAFACVGGQVETGTRTGVFLGCMDPDEKAFKHRFAQEVLDGYPDQDLSSFSDWKLDPDLRRPVVLTTSVLDLIRRRFNLVGESALVDAACSSSLAAIDLTIRALQEFRIDLGVTGGIESNLGPDTFVLFSQLGALAADRCLPFDSRSKGLSQGEGAVVFLFERLSDAERLGHKILALVAGCGASSDGAAASLFEPTPAGQLRAFASAYNGLDPAVVDYVECHGTGTAKGDATELITLKDFFNGHRALIGSVKSLIGHTKGAAGAAGLLKCLLAIQHRTIPPSSYHMTGSRRLEGVYLNKEPLYLNNRDRPLTFGVSSFGFGGINYHLTIQEFSGRSCIRCRVRQDCQVVLVESAHRELSRVQDAADLKALRIIRNSRRQIDDLQVAALLAVQEAACLAQIELTTLPRESVSVISASTLGLQATYSLSNRVRCSELPAALSHIKNRFAPITEDSGPGVLNNVIAGRIANHFDFHGLSFNIDADEASPGAALWTAELLLKSKGGFVIVVAADDRFCESSGQVERSRVECWFLATCDFAKEHSLPIRSYFYAKQGVSASTYAHA